MTSTGRFTLPSEENFAEKTKELAEVFLFCTIKPGLYLWISTIKFEAKMKLLQNMPQK